MAKFRVEIEMENDAMRNPNHVADALEALAERLRIGETEGPIRDENGNTVGSFKLPAKYRRDF